MQKELRLGEIIDRSWELAKKYWLYLIGISILSYMASELATSSMSQQQTMKILESYAKHGDIARAIQSSADVSLMQMGLSFGIGMLIAMLIGIFLEMVMQKILWKGVNEGTGKVDLTALLKSSFNVQFFTFLIIFILYEVLMVVATLFCILPGIFVGVRLVFVPIIAANHPELTMSEVFSRSWSLTRGHFWTLLGYALVAIGINLIGFCCCCVGMLFTAVITEFMLAECYRRLCDEDYPTPEEGDKSEVPAEEVATEETPAEVATTEEQTPQEQTEEPTGYTKEY